MVREDTRPTPYVYYPRVVVPPHAFGVREKGFVAGDDIPRPYF